MRERSQGELQVCFRPRPNQRLKRKVMNARSPESPNLDNFGTPFWESQEKKCHLDASAAERRIEYYMGEGGGFP